MNSRVIGIFICLIMAGPLRSAESYPDIYRILADRHMLPVSTGLTEALNESLVRTLDPGAEFLSDKAEAERRRAAESLDSAERFAGGVGYIKLKGLEQNAPARILETLQSWSNDITGGLVLDLRGAGGNSSEAVDQISGFFLPAGMPVYNLRNPEGKLVQTGKTRATSEAPGIKSPLIVLADTNTSGAAEIFCGSMKGRDGVVLIGGVTSGMPLLRDILPLGDGRYLLISGRRASWPDNPDGKGTACDLGPVSGEMIVGPGKRIGRALSQTEVDSLALAKRLADDPVLTRALDLLLAGTRIVREAGRGDLSDAGNNTGNGAK